MSRREPSPGEDSSDAEADAAFEAEQQAGCQSLLSQLSALSAPVTCPAPSTAALTAALTEVSSAYRALSRSFRAGAARDLEPLWHDPRLYALAAAALTAAWARADAAAANKHAAHAAARQTELVARARERDRERAVSTAATAVTATSAAAGPHSQLTHAGAVSATREDKLRVPRWVPPGVTVVTVTDAPSRAAAPSSHSMSSHNNSNSNSNSHSVSSSSSAGLGGAVAGSTAKQGSLGEIKRLREQAQSHAQLAQAQGSFGPSTGNDTGTGYEDVLSRSFAAGFTPSFVPATPGLTQPPRCATTSSALAANDASSVSQPPLSGSSVAIADPAVAAATIAALSAVEAAAAAAAAA